MMVAKLRAKTRHGNPCLKPAPGRKVVHAKVNGNAFTRMVSDTKKIEFRLRRGKWAALQAGDIIIFTNDDDANQTLTVRVRAVLNYPSLEALFGDFDAVKYTNKTKDELLERILKRNKKARRGYYTREEERRYGVIGIKI